MKYLRKALQHLGVDEFYMEYDGAITTEEDFNKAFFKLVEGEFQQGLEHIEPITWNDISTKAEEIEAAEPLRLLREERNRRLQESDWYMLPDRSPTQKHLDYRQALRDITNTYTSLDDVVWPEKPE